MKQQRKKKILFAAVDIGWRIEHYSNYIQQHYRHLLEAESLVIFKLPSKHYKTSYTYSYDFQNMSAVYRWYRSLLNFIVCLFRYDTFHFLSGETLLTRKLRRYELGLYKLFKKRIVMHFVGTDIRSVEYIKWKEQNIEQFIDSQVTYPKTLPWQDKLIRDAKQYADAVLVSSPDLLSVIPEAQYYPVVIDLEKYLTELGEQEELEKHNDQIVILHAPSNPEMKGTKIIHHVLKKVASESPYHIKLILTSDTDSPYSPRYSVSRYDLFRLYREADIVVDQMIIGWYGLQAIESLAAKCQVISYVDKELERYLFPNCPIRIANVKSLEDTVLQCIEAHIHGVINYNSNIDWLKKYHTLEENNMALKQAWGVVNSL